MVSKDCSPAGGEKNEDEIEQISQLNVSLSTTLPYRYEHEILGPGMHADASRGAEVLRGTHLRLVTNLLHSKLHIRDPAHRSPI